VAIPTSINDRQSRSFEEDPLVPGDTRRKVTATIATSQGPIKVTGPLVTVAYDAIAAAYPSVTEEVYTYFTGGLAGTLVATVTVTYTTAAKTVLTSVVRT